MIFITLKDCKGDTYLETLELLAIALRKEFIRHKYLLIDLEIEEAYRSDYEALYWGKATEAQMKNSLGLLSDMLTAHWGIPPLVLLDEYDTPVHVAFDKGFYNEMVSFMRIFMSSVFKYNTDIFRGVITGILRISKESGIYP